MTRTERFRSSGLIALAVGFAALASPAVAADADHPTVVELFQSQGCSSCLPADANAAALAGQPGVLVLSFAVTYWDGLGWKDTFASPLFTARQWMYERRLARATVFTPQVVVNGRRDGVGVDPRELRGLIVKGDRGDGGPAIALRRDAVSLSTAPAPAKPADVWLVRYDPRVIMVSIRRGENGGKTVPHKNIVRELTRLGSWTGQAESLPIAQAGDPALRTAILVQLPGGGPILAATDSG